MTEKERKSDCAVNCGLEIFGDKWTLLIVRDLIFNNKRYYGDFLKSEEKIATNILASRLLLLEKSGIIVRLENSKNKLKFIYKLTAKGIDLLPVLLEIMRWSEKHEPSVHINPELRKEFKNPDFKERTIKELQKEFLTED